MGTCMAFMTHRYLSSHLFLKCRLLFGKQLYNCACSYIKKAPLLVTSVAENDCIFVYSSHWSLCHPQVLWGVISTHLQIIGKNVALYQCLWKSNEITPIHDNFSLTTAFWHLFSTLECHKLVSQTPIINHSTSFLPDYIHQPDVSLHLRFKSNLLTRSLYKVMLSVIHYFLAL